MSIHSKRLPTPPPPSMPLHTIAPLPAPDAPRPEARRVAPREQPPEGASPASPPVTRPPGASDAAAPTLPWYRREPWVTMTIVACLSVAVAIVAPERAKVPLVALGGLAMLVAVVMLLRQGAFRAAAGDTPRRDAAEGGNTPAT
jgi:hypothetical protein